MNLMKRTTHLSTSLVRSMNAESVRAQVMQNAPAVTDLVTERGAISTGTRCELLGYVGPGRAGVLAHGLRQVQAVSSKGVTLVEMVRENTEEMSECQPLSTEGDRLKARAWDRTVEIAESRVVRRATAERPEAPACITPKIHALDLARSYALPQVSASVVCRRSDQA